MRKLWTEEEITYLIKYNKKKPLKEIAKDLGRSLNSIENKSQELTAKGVKFKNRSKNEWTLEEDDILLKDFGRYNINSLCKKLKRTRSAINHRLNFLCGTCEVEQVSDCYRIKTICEITGLNRSTINRFMNLGQLKYIQFDNITRVVDGDYFWKWIKENINKINVINISEDIFETLPTWYQREINNIKRSSVRVKNSRWTKTEKALLKHYLTKDLTYKQIADKLGRSEYSVQKIATKIFLQKA